MKKQKLDQKVNSLDDVTGEITNQEDLTKWIKEYKDIDQQYQNLQEQQKVLNKRKKTVGEFITNVLPPDSKVKDGETGWFFSELHTPKKQATVAMYKEAIQNIIEDNDVIFEIEDEVNKLVKSAQEEQDSEIKLNYIS